MTLISPDMKMAEVIHQNHLLIPIINRFGIRLGFGEKTVKAVCNDLQTDPDFFITIINTFNNENYFPEKKLLTFDVLLLLKYLRKTHNYYLDVQIPLIERSIDALINASSQNPNLELVKKFFLSYKKELLIHISREEAVTFPYIEKIQNFSHNLFDNEGYKAFCDSIKNYSIRKFDEEHDNIDDKLYDLQNILIKYVSGAFDETLINTIIFEVFRLEKDIKDHTRLEDKILIPMVAEMENVLNAKLVGC